MAVAALSSVYLWIKHVSNCKRITTVWIMISILLSSLHGGSSTLLGIFALILAKSFSTTLCTAIKDILSVLVHLQLNNSHLAGVNAYIDCGSISFLPLDPLNVDPELAPVALDYLANLLPLVVPPHHLHLVVLPDRHRPHSILSAELFGQRSRHQTAPNVGWGGKMPFAAFGPV